MKTEGKLSRLDQHLTGLIGSSKKTRAAILVLQDDSSELNHAPTIRLANMTPEKAFRGGESHGQMVSAHVLGGAIGLELDLAGEWVQLTARKRNRRLR